MMKIIQQSNPSKIKNVDIQKDPKAAEKMRAKGIFYLHGGDLTTLTDVARHGKILSAAEQDALKNTDGLKEDTGFTQRAILNSYLRRGVSIFAVELCNSAKHYTTRGSTTPIIFGLNRKVDLAPGHITAALTQDLSKDSIDLKHIQRILIPSGSMATVKQTLIRSDGDFVPALIKKLEENPRVLQQPVPRTSRRYAI